LKTILPEDGMNLNYPPENKFMPLAENLKNIKLERVDKDKPGNPTLIDEDRFELWHKQDDSFEQPFVFMQAKIKSNDCDLPHSL
jgi:secreted Zn-dependent insulinase-like peptidase